jgi:glycosyltransferase involved in cell wall biosynthesis
MSENYNSAHIVLIISAVFPPEPVVSAILSRDLAEVLSQKINVEVICPKPSRPEGFNFEDRIKSDNYKVIEQNSYTCASSKIIGRLRESYSFGVYCVKYIVENRNKIKCIYINSWPLLSQYLIVKAARRYDIKCVLHIQDIYPESLLTKIPIGKYILKKILLPIDKYSLKNSNSIIAISDDMKRYLMRTRQISKDLIHVVPNWQDEEAFISYKDSKFQKENDIQPYFTFMYLGNNGPLAGIEYIINSFVKAKIPDSKLIIAGSGSRKNACIQLVKSLNVSNIEFLEVPQGMVPNIQDKADVLLLPVRKNGAMSSIPSKLPAYMYSSKPIIGSLDLESETAKAIKESGCGIVVEPENEVQLIKVIKDVSKWDIQTRNKKGNLGFEYAMKNFSKKTNLQKVVTIIENII